MQFDGATIFVTGGAGFIGSAVCRHLLANTRANVVNLDRLTYAANLDNIPAGPGNSRYAFERADICDGGVLRRLFSQYEPQAVMNLAAESHVDRSIDGPGEFIQTNVVGSFTLLQETLRYYRGQDEKTSAFCIFLPTRFLARLAKTACFRKRRLMRQTRPIPQARLRLTI
jgi:dTDP-glucose 4,6-dehydratase